jgi:flagellar biosynthesis protein FliQ
MRPSHTQRLMSHAQIVDLARNAILLSLLVAAPMLAVSLGIGLAVSIFQSVTQIQEQTLVFLPKLVGVSAIFLVALPWMVQLLVKFTTELFRGLPQFAA